MIFAIFVFICDSIITQDFRKVVKLFDVMSTRIYTSLKPFNFIRKHFLQIYVWKVAVHL
jgi:hypothetical protein